VLRQAHKGPGPNRSRPDRDVPVRPHDLPPGQHASRKEGECGPPGLHVPVAAEIECAHLIANEARESLRKAGLEDAEILALADDFIAEDRGSDTMEFIQWAIYMHDRSRRRVATKN